MFWDFRGKNDPDYDSESEDERHRLKILWWETVALLNII